MNSPIPTLPYTGERMVPFACDAAVETIHWQPYLFFRPFYAGKNIIDAGFGEGYGTAYASNFAIATLGVESSQECVQYAAERYPDTRFAQGDVCDVDYSEADLVLCFATLEHLANPEAFLDAAKYCAGTVVVSAFNRLIHSPNNSLQHRPINEFRRREWSPFEFVELIKAKFAGRRIQFLSQEPQWPGRIVEGVDEAAMSTIAVIGDVELPHWPAIGLAMPTVNEAARAVDAIAGIGRTYPGRVEVCLIANGSSPDSLQKLREFQRAASHVCHLVELDQNVGYGRGANRGLEFLLKRGTYDLVGVTNDDVIPAVDCISQQVTAYAELQRAGQNPGMVAPVSNAVAGLQMVDIGRYTDYIAMMNFAESWHRAHHSSATPAIQIRGLFFLCDPHCIQTIGGFDPRFGLGNFEDDDFNVRMRLAGYTMWIVDGAYLHHEGSSTFKALNIAYDENLCRNEKLFLEKWRAADVHSALTLDSVPEGVHLFSPLDQVAERSGITVDINGSEIDLVHEATDAELALWLAQQISTHPREARYAIVDAVRKLAA